LARRKRPAARDDAFFDRFRSAIARLPAGLIRAHAPAGPDEIARAEKELGRPLPAAYASFLRSFDGADLFHESIVIAGVGSGAPRTLQGLPQDRPGELVFAEALWGDRYALDAEGRVLRYDPGADERALAGTSFERWLDATVAREQILFGPDGEYAEDVFDPAGQEVTPTIALRQSERALKVDPGAADSEHARGLALVRLGRRDAALSAFRAASELDADNPWPLFDLGRTALALDRPAVAFRAFQQAAAATREDATAARLLAWAVRAALAAGDDAAAKELRREAIARDPQLVAGLTRAASAAGDEADDEAREEEVALLEAVAPGTPVPRRLRVIPH
jgi:tetratricopeptide (TPR) repeat protein